MELPHGENIRIISIEIQDPGPEMDESNDYMEVESLSYPGDMNMYLDDSAISGDIGNSSFVFADSPNQNSINLSDVKVKKDLNNLETSDLPQYDMLKPKSIFDKEHFFEFSLEFLKGLPETNPPFCVTRKKEIKKNADGSEVNIVILTEKTKNEDKTITITTTTTTTTTKKIYISPTKTTTNSSTDVETSTTTIPEDENCFNDDEAEGLYVLGLQMPEFEKKSKIRPDTQDFRDGIPTAHKAEKGKDYRMKPKISISITVYDAMIRVGFHYHCATQTAKATVAKSTKVCASKIAQKHGAGEEGLEDLIDLAEDLFICGENFEFVPKTLRNAVRRAINNHDSLAMTAHSVSTYVSPESYKTFDSFVGWVVSNWLRKKVQDPRVIAAVEKQQKEKDKKPERYPNRDPKDCENFRTIGPDGNKELKCKYCNKVYTNLHAFKQHKYSHQENIKKTCALCNHKFMTTKKFDNHRCKGLVVHKCSICQKVFRTKFYLKLHEKNHEKTTQSTGVNDGSNNASQQVYSTTQASNGVTSTTQTVVTAQSGVLNQGQQQQHQQSHQITIQNANAQQFTVIPTTSLGQEMGTIQNFSGLRNVQLIPAGTLAQQSQNVQGQQIGSSPIVMNVGNLGIGAQQIQQDPLDPTKLQVVNQVNTSLNIITTSHIQTGTVATIKTELDKPKTKRRRVACTCPNCADIDARNNGEKKKQHSCHIAGCNKVYGNTGHLRTHLRWHEGIKSFGCDWPNCGKTFIINTDLIRHRRTHTGEKRFQCSECLKKFSQSHHLSRHIKTHTKNIADGVQATKTVIDGKLIKSEILEQEVLEGEDGEQELEQ